MYFDLIKSLFDYMLEINYNNIGLIANSNDLRIIKKIFLD